MLCLCGFELYSRWVPLNEVSAFILVRLTFYENLLIGQETRACCPHSKVLSWLNY